MAKMSKPQPMKTKERVDPETSKDIGFTLKAVTKKPSRKYRKGSKYDPILDAFLKQDQKMVTITIDGKEANYIRTQLNKRISAEKKYSGIKISVINNIAYLEKE